MTTKYNIKDTTKLILYPKYILQLRYSAKCYTKENRKTQALKEFNEKDACVFSIKKLMQG